MKHLTGSEIRQMWLNFFRSKGHEIIPGKSLIPYQDPTLLWINSGVAALKKFFDGSEIPSHKRLANAQKSLRTNDIDQVGYTSRHHTFFEMLGNFSIGDYFRKEAITWAFELLFSPEWFGFDKDKLYMTYSPLDIETAKLWESLGISPDHLIPLEGNFWEIGEGPCGPDTEIFYDRGPAFDAQHLGIKLLKEEIPNDRYIEIWNIVFSQYQAVKGQRREQYKELPSKNIDTGAGLERLASIFQETPTNFETDLFYPIILQLQTLASIDYLTSEYRPYRVIADHIRTLTFALADGAVFSSEGRGYVLRRLLRRALRYGKKIGIHNPFLSSLVPTVISIMVNDYPYLSEHQSQVMKMIHHEEVRFNDTLHHGEILLKSFLDKKAPISGEVAFKLYDTYGFPFELTQEIAQESRLTVDQIGFENLMESQRERARQARQQFGSMAKQSADLLKFTTISKFEEHGSSTKATIIGLFKQGVQVDSLTDEGEVILDFTNFYAESGGQTSDKGFLFNHTTRVEVLDVQKAPHKQHLHRVQFLYGTLSVGDSIQLELDETRRQKITQHHSSLHLLQASLKQFLGPHVIQQGSFVGDEYARFDFSHPDKIPDEELQKIESDVNGMIQSGYLSTIEVLPIEEAKKTGAIAPFEEKYGDMVRIVTLGPRSKEFCGGTHVRNTQEIGLFAIRSEESIAAGIRRITVVTGAAAYAYFKEKNALIHQLKQHLHAQSEFELIDRLKVMISEKDGFKKQLIKAQQGHLEGLLTQWKTQLTHDPYVKGFFYEPSLDRSLMIQAFDRLKMMYPDGFFVLIGKDNDQYPIGVYLSTGLQTKQTNASTLVKSIAAFMQGSGGGKPNLAFGAGKVMPDLASIWNHIKL